jgi:hypothetical protein
LAAPKEDIIDAEIVEDAPMKALEGPRRALDAPKRTPMEGPQVDQNHQDKTQYFANDPESGTRRVDRRDSSFAEHLDANEAKYLAERKSRLSSIQQAGLGMREKPSGNVALKAPAGSTGKNADIMFAQARNNNNAKASGFQQKARQRAIDSGQIADNSKTVNPGTNSRTVRDPRANIQA